MGCCGKQPSLPDAGAAAAQGIKTDTQLQPFSYLINAASTVGQPITLGGKTYDFSGLGQADIAGTVSDQMAQTLLALQTEKSPTIIQQRINELKAADPIGYAARKQLFDRIAADAQANPDRPIAADLQKQIETELAKGVSPEDARQASQIRDLVRGGQVRSGITLGNAAAAQEAAGVIGAGEALRNQRQQNAMNMLAAGTSPEDVAYRRMQQSLANLANFQAGQTPTAQFRQVSGAASGPVIAPNWAPATNTFNPGAAGQGMQNALGVYSGQVNWAQSQANPWLAGLSLATTGAGTLNSGGFFGGGGAGAPNASAAPGMGGLYTAPGITL